MFSIIVCSHRPERASFIARHYADLFRGQAHEFILIDDAKSLCEGYARGLARSTGDRLIFSHDDIEFVLPDTAARLARNLEEFDVIGIAGTSKLIDGAWMTTGDPYAFGVVIYPRADQPGMYTVNVCGAGPLNVGGIQALDGCFIACKREVAERTGFDAATFDGFHHYDLDFTFRAHLLGYRLAVCRDIPLIHASMGNPDAVWQTYKNRFEQKHRATLARGQPAHMRTVQSLLSREKLLPSLQQGMAASMIDTLTKQMATQNAGFSASPPPSNLPHATGPKMHDTAFEFGKRFFDTYLSQARDLTIVEIGSQDVNGSLRSVAPAGNKYIGVDFASARGVDIVLKDPYSLPFEDNSIDVMVSSSCFEHSEFFWLVFNEVLRVLKPNGLFYLDVPANGAFHRYPVDCWRFYPDSGAALRNWGRKSGYKVLMLESFTGMQGPDMWNDNISVFLKDEQFLANHPRRIQDSFTNFTNGFIHGRPEISNVSMRPQDQDAHAKLVELIQSMNRILAAKS